jgi:hypothetical protein
MAARTALMSGSAVPVGTATGLVFFSITSVDKPDWQ